MGGPPCWTWVIIDDDMQNTNESNGLEDSVYGGGGSELSSFDDEAAPACPPFPFPSKSSFKCGGEALAAPADEDG